MASPATAKRQRVDAKTTMRGRILDAAFAAFKANGYSATSTLEIATRARVSKRDLYTRVGNKQDMLIACIGDRAKRLQVPGDLTAPDDWERFEQLLAEFGTRLIREISDPAVVAVFRLAIGEAVRAPEVARALDSIGRETSRTALRQIMAAAGRSGLLNGQPNRLAEQFGGLLWCDLMISLLLGVADRPGPGEIAKRAADAAVAFRRIHELPG